MAVGGGEAQEGEDPAGGAQKQRARLPRAIALRDVLLFRWCGKLVKAARHNRALHAEDAGYALPPGGKDDIAAQASAPGGQSAASPEAVINPKLSSSGIGCYDYTVGKLLPQGTNTSVECGCRRCKERRAGQRECATRQCKRYQSPDIKKRG